MLISVLLNREHSAYGHKPTFAHTQRGTYEQRHHRWQVEATDGKAKAAWGELTDDELTRSEGNAERLAGLIQERYGKTKEQAQKEVRDFFDQNR